MKFIPTIKENDSYFPFKWYIVQELEDLHNKSWGNFVIKYFSILLSKIKKTMKNEKKMEIFFINLCLNLKIYKY